MMTEDWILTSAGDVWEPTCNLRYSVGGVLEQLWVVRGTTQQEWRMVK